LGEGNISHGEMNLMAQAHSPHWAKVIWQKRS